MISKRQIFKVGVLPVDAYERTGAGDAFGSGCLSALIHGKPLDEALLWGTCNSASVIGYTGSQKGLLKDSEMPVWLERAKSSGVSVVNYNSINMKILYENFCTSQIPGDSS